MASRKEQSPEAFRSMNEEELDSIVDRITGDPTLKPERGQKPEIKTAHERLVGDVVELAGGLFEARTGRKPDDAYLEEMRKIYALKSDESLRIETDKLMAELNLISKN